MSQRLSRPRRCVLILIGVAVLWPYAASQRAAGDWPRWRGPNSTGAVEDRPTPIHFDEPEQYAWQIELPGQGASTPAVVGDALVLTSTVEEQDAVICYGLDGELRWQLLLGPARPGKHREGSGAAPSPAVDDERIVVYFKSGTLAAVDWQGNKLWQCNLQDEYGPDTLWWDLGTSPVLADGKVIVAIMQAGPSWLVARDAATGKEVWKTDRTYQRPRESDQAYTTPSIVDVDGQMTIVTWGADHLTGHALDTGELLWDCGGFNPANAGMWRVIASQAIADGMAVVPYGRGDFVAGVKLGGEGDVTQSNRIWERQGFGSDVPTPAVADGRAYVLGDQGRLVCLDVATGDTLWDYEFPRNRNKFFSSPTLAGDTLYCARLDAAVFVGRVSPEGFELLATNELNDRMVAAPVSTEAGLLLRGSEHLTLVKE